ncbi:MAG: hypothetical protein NUV60_01370 [Patescibacteria group bacterium]|nr:hypothetical protein [Patescibacteria group bacterium]
MISKQMIVRGLVLAALSVLFAGCATTSQFNGYASAPAGAEKAVQEGRFVEEAMAQVAIVQNPDFNQGKISAKAVQKIQQYAISCQRQIDAQLAGPGQSGLNGVLPYGAAGLGIGPAAALAFSGAKMAEYATYGGVSYLFSGAVNGLVTGSYAMASAKGSCTREFWEDIAKSDPDFRGTHVMVVYAGKASGGSVPPALDKGAVVAPKGPVLDRSLIRR